MIFQVNFLTSIKNLANGVVFVQLCSPGGAVTMTCIQISLNANFYFSSEIYFNFS